MRRDLEHQHQKALVTWAGYAAGGDPRLRLLYAIPNGGQRTKATAGKLKAEGVRAGVPDLCLPVPVRETHALYIEMKVGAGRATAEQKIWQRELAAAGNAVCIAYGWEAAKDAITDYLRGMWPSREVVIYRAEPMGVAA